MRLYRNPVTGNNFGISSVTLRKLMYPHSGERNEVRFEENICRPGAHFSYYDTGPCISASVCLYGLRGAHKRDRLYAIVACVLLRTQGKILLTRICSTAKELEVGAFLALVLLSVSFLANSSPPPFESQGILPSRFRLARGV